MTISFQRLYRNSSFLITAIGVVIGFLLFARGYSGYAFDGQKLGLLCDVTLSSGIFLVGIPLLMSLILPEGYLVPRKYFGLQRVTFVLQILGLLLSLSFVFMFDNSGYVGFIQFPTHGKVFFLVALLISILSALTYLVERLTITHKNYISSTIFPVILLFSACGVALSLLTMQMVGMFSAESELYTATIPINEFFRQILIVSSLAGFTSRLIMDSSFDQKKTFLTIVSAVSSAFLMVGFQASALNDSSSDWLFLLNQGASAVGLSGIIWLSGKLMFKEWKLKGREFVENGLWVSHFVFLLALFLTLILQVGMGRLLLSFGPLDNIRLALLLFAAPLTMIRAVDHRPLYSQVTRSIVSALHWCGIFIVVSAIFMIAPHGGSIGGVANEAFRSFYGIAMTGLFMIALSYAIVLWDKILGEVI